MTFRTHRFWSQSLCSNHLFLFLNVKFFTLTHTHTEFYILFTEITGKEEKNSTTQSLTLGPRAKYSQEVAVLFRDMNHSEYWLMIPSITRYLVLSRLRPVPFPFLFSASDISRKAMKILASHPNHKNMHYPRITPWPERITTHSLLHLQILLNAFGFLPPSNNINDRFTFH